MESQMIRPQGYTHEQDPFNKAHHDPISVEGGEEHREKKSVLKKVKAKAKKLKDTITNKHSHGHNQGHDDHDRLITDDHDLDEEDEEDYDESPEPEVHGAPMYESERATLGAKPEEDIPLSSFSFSDHSSPSPKQNVEPTKVNLGLPGGLEEDPHAPGGFDPNPSNYQTKLSAPTGTGAEEMGINPMVRSFDKMNIDENPKQSKYESPIGTGSHDQFSPELKDLDNTTVAANPESEESTTQAPGYISAATSAITGRALSAKNMVASKLGYGEKDNTTVPESDTKPTVTESNTKPATSVIADRAISAKSMVASKLGYGEKDSTTVSECDTKPIVTESTESNTKPVTSVIADRAISAKNMLASKLGYGEEKINTDHDTSALGEKDGSAPQNTATEYGKKIASTVYGTVAGAGTAVMSKLPLGTGTRTGTHSTTTTTTTEGEAKDRGVSVKEYLAEKLRPGEDDRALSEAISEAVHKRKPETGEEEVPMGRVTESEEVKRQLGGDDDNVGFGEKGNAGGYVDKVKGTVGSWLGYGSSPKSTTGEKVSDDVKEERVLQESGN